LKSIPWAKPTLFGDEEAYLKQALESTWLSGGPFVEELEATARAFSGFPYCLAVSNGTAAIHLAYLALGLKAGDEVIVPGFCYLAAANIALLMGLSPVFVDVDPSTYCVTAEKIRGAITKKTKLIVVVHTYGNVCPMDEIMVLAKSCEIPVLEDAAESLGSQYKGRQSGTIADIGTYSFHATKTVTTGEGGMVLTGRKVLADQAMLYRTHGVLGKRYWHEVPGHNFRLTNLQAALGCAQFKKIDHIFAERRRVHASYRRLFDGEKGITLQRFDPDVEPVLWALAAELDQKYFPQGRDRLMEQLAEQGIETRNGFYSANQLKIYSNVKSIPISDRLAKNVISLPTFPTLKDEQIDFIAKAIIALKKK
jgi:perosamine synthetase